MNCTSSSYCLGLIVLKNKQYCISDKQYSREDYEKLRIKIIEHMNAMPYIDKLGNMYRYGEFFPIEFSPYPYNDTVTQDHLPKSESEIIKNSFIYEALEDSNAIPTIEASKLPSTIQDTGDEITKEIIACSHNGRCDYQCNRVYRVLPKELEFYGKFNLPLPRICINYRHYERISQRIRIHLYTSIYSCEGVKSGNYTNHSNHDHGSFPCATLFEILYPPENKSIIYC